jgi:hypothetical protein
MGFLEIVRSKNEGQDLKEVLTYHFVGSATVNATGSVLFLQSGSLEVIVFLIRYDIYCLLYCG